MYVKKIVCSECGEEYPPDYSEYQCDCDGKGKPEVVYDYGKLREDISKSKLKKRDFNLWRYKEFMPNKNINVTLGEGGTPLQKADRLADELGVDDLYIKNETVNPTASFKDRPISVGVNKAIDSGAENVVTASSGNAAAALSALGAKAGLNVTTFVPGDAPLGKISQLMMYGANVFPVREDDEKGDSTVKMMKRTWKEFGWHPVPSFGTFNPYQLEGGKSMAFEILEQLDYEVPDFVSVPVGGAGLFVGNYKGFRDFERIGFIDEIPRLGAIQASGCAPMVKAWKEKGEMKTWKDPETIAGGLADPYTWDWDIARKGLDKSSGVAEGVDDDLIFEAEKMLAKYEGVFVEPSGAASLAGVMKLLRNGELDKSDTIVVEATGSGFKDIDIVVDNFGKPDVIDPDLEEVEKRI